jgi:mannonate dehydratase
VPDAWAAQVARTRAHRFGWVASIHPYREDAVVRLRQAIALGALAIKWLPSAMNIDLRDARCVPFYELLANAQVPLVVHGGEEKAVPGAGRDEFGNPLLVREPLSHGVRVIVAHCASLGSANDLDARRPHPTDAFALFTRLMNEPEWEGRLFGDVSAVWQINRSAEVWRRVIRQESWHPRLLHGSDYPLPCVPLLVQPAALARAGLLQKQEVATLEALRQHNPLLFDFVLKRRLRWRGARLADAVFQTRRHFETSRSAPHA